MKSDKKIVMHSSTLDEIEITNRIGGFEAGKLSLNYFISHVKIVSGERDLHHADLLFLSANTGHRCNFSTSVSLGIEMLMSLLSGLFDNDSVLHASELGSDKDNQLIECFYNTSESMDIVHCRNNSNRMLQILIDDIENQMKVLPQYVDLPVFDGPLTLEKVTFFYKRFLELIQKKRVEFAVFGEEKYLVGRGVFSSVENCLHCVNDQYLSMFSKPERIVGNYVAEKALLNSRTDEEFLMGAIASVLGSSNWKFEEESSFDFAKMALCQLLHLNASRFR